MGRFHKGIYYEHQEAFCLMQYRCSDCGYEEMIWNSRDGVTPFSMQCPKCHKSGLGSMFHIKWYEDRCVPDHAPPPGDRIFINLSQDIARIYYRMRVEQCWEHPEFSMKERFRNKEHAINVLMNEYDPCEPYLITL